MDIQDDRLPVTLLTGFLGAGKTTLLNSLIRDPEAGRIAVIMNEFGDVGLDHDLIEEVTDDVVLMHAGCLCCSIRGDLAKTMALLLSRRQRGELAFDRIVIETTGIADPGPILNTMVTDDQIAPNFRSDGVVVLADAATGQRTLDTQFEAVRQIAMADLIIVTKTDLVTPRESELFEARLDGINPSARRLGAKHGRVPIDALFGLSALRPSANSDDVAGWMGASPPLASAQTDPEGHGRPHDHRIHSASIELSEPIPPSVFDFWLDTLMAHKGADILRLKGIVHFEDVDGPFVFHGVQHIFEAPVPLRSWSRDDKKSRVVVIARDTEAGDLEACLEILRMRPIEPAAKAKTQMVDVNDAPF